MIMFILGCCAGVGLMIALNLWWDWREYQDEVEP